MVYVRFEREGLFATLEWRIALYVKSVSSLLEHMYIGYFPYITILYMHGKSVINTAYVLITIRL